MSRRNPRYRFLNWGEMKKRAQEMRRGKLTPEQSRAKTDRIEKRELVRSNPPRGWKRRNPGTARYQNILKLVRETAAEFKRKYGGQAVGWAADAASTARDETKARFFRRVTDLLRHDQYAMNPKRYSRQKRKGKKPGGTEARLFAKSKRASRMMDRHETWDPNAKNRRRKKWRSAHRRTYKHLAAHYRRNPKRDGTPTRGEVRAGRYKDHLRALRERGAKAADELNKLLGRGAHRPHAEPALKAPTTQTQLEHPGHYAAEESSDQKFAKEQLSQVESLMTDVRSQMKDLTDADEALADELSGQLIKLGAQRRALQERAKGAPAMSNPRRGRNPRYTSPARYRKMNTAAKARYRRALRLLRSTVHSI